MCYVSQQKADFKVSPNFNIPFNRSKEWFFIEKKSKMWYNIINYKGV